MSWDLASGVRHLLGAHRSHGSASCPVLIGDIAAHTGS
jgi:hypothetical protein